jgi:F-type H+-transporting ATPase subunit b
MDFLNATLFGEMLTFAVLVFITLKYIWPPIIKAINDRQQKIAEGLEAAERARHDLALAQKESLRLVQEAKVNAAKLIDHAQHQVILLIEQGKGAAQKEGEQTLALVRADIEKEKSSLQQQIQQQIITTALLIAEKILQANMDPDKNQRVIENLLHELNKNN